MRRHDVGADVFNLSPHKNGAAVRGIAVLLIVLAIVASVNPANAIGAPVTESVQDKTGEDTAAILAAARKIFIRSRTAYMKPVVLENALREKPEFEQLELMITQDLSEADLIVEVDRAIFTLEFPFRAVDPETKIVVASGKVISLGGTVAGEIASSLIKQIKVARGILPPRKK
ncbi:MAG: hypothetical protein L0229_14790 [Blastocatellia bacterium]|nr:hypothetical protein [Blastocatellia bacterium]